VDYLVILLFYATNTRSYCAYLDTLGKFWFQAEIRLQKWMPGSGRIRDSKWCRFTTLATKFRILCPNVWRFCATFRQI